MFEQPRIVFGEIDSPPPISRHQIDVFAKSSIGPRMLAILAERLCVVHDEAAVARHEGMPAVLQVFVVVDEQGTYLSRAEAQGKNGHRVRPLPAGAERNLNPSAIRVEDHLPAVGRDLRMLVL